MTLERIIRRLEELSLPEPEPLCWMIVNGEYHYEPYCPDCAEKVLAYCVKGDDAYRDEKCSEWAELPDKVGSEDDIYYVKTTDMRIEGVEVCHLCGKQLLGILTESGVESELNHFERLGMIVSTRELREIYDIFWAIQYSHGDEECDYYERAIALGERIEPMVAKLEKEVR